MSRSWPEMRWIFEHVWDASHINVQRALYNCADCSRRFNKSYLDKQSLAAELMMRPIFVLTNYAIYTPH